MEIICIGESFMLRQKFKMLTIAGMTLFLSGCAMTLASKSINGDITELSQMIHAGQIGPNDTILTNNGSKHSPFCIITYLPGAAAEAEFRYMLDHGALVNQKCELGTPLDEVKWRAAIARHVPEKLARWVDRAQLLIEHKGHFQYGNSSNSGEVTLAAFYREINDVGDSSDKFDDERAADMRRAKKDSFFSAENLGAVVAVAGLAVNNYAAARGQTSSVALPLPPNLNFPIPATTRTDVGTQQTASSGASANSINRTQSASEAKKLQPAIASNTESGRISGVPAKTSAGPVFATNKDFDNTTTAALVVPAKEKQPRMGQDNGSCISYGATIPVGKTVCFAESLEQWRCEGWYGKSVFNKVQKITMKSQIREKSLCFHVDEANQRPLAELQME